MKQADALKIPIGSIVELSHTGQLYFKCSKVKIHSHMPDRFFNKGDGFRTHIGGVDCEDIASGDRTGIPYAWIVGLVK